MKKRIVSAILVVCLMLSCIAVAGISVNAATVETEEAASSSLYTLADSVDEGVILQAWNWSYANVEANLEKLASLGFTTIQVSPPSIIKAETKGINVYYGSSGTTGWWMFYQPAGFTLNTLEDNALGTVDELKSLTSKAHELGMRIIADGVINHLGTNQGEDGTYTYNGTTYSFTDGYDENGTARDGKTILRVTAEAYKYEPEILAAEAFHPYFNTIYLENNDTVSYYISNLPDYIKYKSYGVVSSDYNQSGTAEYHSTFDQTQGSISNLPDLDTSTDVVQTAILDYFKECVDAGIDGFRIDAAKHIETPDDPVGIASDFWPNVFYGANEYALETTGEELFYYGEILNNCGIDRPFSRYLKYIEITDSSTYYGQFNAIGGSPSSYGSSYSGGMDASNAITWSESHDIYMDYYNWGQNVPTENVINKRWALAAARDNTAMYFARPSDVYSTKLGDADITGWANTEVAAVNKFHTVMSGESEYISASGSFAINERGTTGVVIVNCTGNATDINNLTMNRLQDGTYTDHVSGNTFVCKDGKLSGTMGNTGIVVLYKDNVPKVGSSVESGNYNTDTQKVKLSAKNVDYATYAINGEVQGRYESGTTVTIGSASDAYGATYELAVYGYNNDKLVAVNVYTYTKIEKESTYFVSAESSWSTVYCYAWGNGENAAWPGQAMTKLANGNWYIELDGNYTNLIFNNNSEQTADLSISESTHYVLNGTTVVSTTSNVETPNIFYPNGYEPTTPPPTNNASGYEMGDANLDNHVNISDVTTIQKYLVKLLNFNDDQLSVSDYDNSGSINIKDATAIQYALLK